MYRTYRPQTFEQVVGQQIIIKTLKNAIKENKISHAYLFCGPRGTGKTTLARLFAKALNCLDNKDEILCNKCSSCVSINNGDHPDVIEIDAASNSGVDSVRELIEQVNYQPILGRYKVYIIDEVHNMSNAAFNALLKTLEEPPSYCVFILCTTEPNKLLPTILSRVQRFDFSKVSNKDLIANMETILNKEKVSYTEEALYQIACLADGGVRDSLSLLDQVLAYVDKNITLDDINNLFGLLTLSEKLKYVEYLHNNDLDNCLKKLNEDYSKGIDLLKLHDDLTLIYKDYLIYSLTKDESLFKIINKQIYKNLNLSVEEANKNLMLLLKGRQDYKKAGSIYDNFEMVLINIFTLNTSKFQASQPIKPITSVQTVSSKPVETTQSTIPNQAKTEEPQPNYVQYDNDTIIELMHNNNKDLAMNFNKTLQENFQSRKLLDINAYIMNLLESCIVLLYSMDTVVLRCSDNNKFQKLILENNQKDLINIFKLLDPTKKITKVLFLTDSSFEDYKNLYLQLKKENKLEKYAAKQTKSKVSNSDAFLSDILK